MTNTGRSSIGRGRLLTAPFRLLPDAVILGAQRSGTTTLYHTLIQHPEIGAVSTKEVHFFDNNHSRGNSWYRGHFPTVFERLRHRVAGRRLLAIEASPYYLFHPHAPARLKALIPHAKLIVILRDPVERAYSHYHHSRRKGYEPLSFEEAIDREGHRLMGEVERMLDDPNYFSAAHQRWSYASRGMYIDQLTAWLRLFQREQLLVLHVSDLAREPAATWARVFDFLGVARYEFADAARWSVGSYTELRPETREMLRERFKPHNTRLFEFLGHDLGWNGSL